MKDTLVITPTLGTRDTLKQTIDSVASVAGNRVHHIITAPSEVVSSLRESYPHLEVVAEASKSGIYAAVNGIIKERIHCFKYVAYINDDDFWLSDFRELFAILDDNPLVDAAISRVAFLLEDGSTRKIAHTRNYKTFRNLVTHSVIPFTQQGVLMRSKVFSENSGFDENYRLVADTDFWLRSIERGHTYRSLGKICAMYRVHNTQLSSDRHLQAQEHAQLIFKHQMHPTFKSILDLVFFRLENLHLYLARLFK